MSMAYFSRVRFPRFPAACLAGDAGDCPLSGSEDDALGQVIKAFVVADEILPRAEDRIKAHCRARLAAYKIPRHITFVDALPRTASGKVRRVQLTEQTASP